MQRSRCRLTSPEYFSPHTESSSHTPDDVACQRQTSPCRTTLCISGQRGHLRAAQCYEQITCWCRAVLRFAWCSDCWSLRLLRFVGFFLQTKRYFLLVRGDPLLCITSRLFLSLRCMCGFSSWYGRRIRSSTDTDQFVQKTCTMVLGGGSILSV